MNEAEQLQWLEQHGATVEFKREFVKVRVEVAMSHAFNVRGDTLLAAIAGIQQLQEGYDRASRQEGRGQTHG
jgi:hypothetical protein